MKDESNANQFNEAFKSANAKQFNQIFSGGARITKDRRGGHNGNPRRSYRKGERKVKVKLPLPERTKTRLKHRPNHNSDSVSIIKNCVKHIEKACTNKRKVEVMEWTYSECKVHKNLIWIKFKEGSLKIKYSFINSDYKITLTNFADNSTEILKELKKIPRYEKSTNNDADDPVMRRIKGTD